MSNFPLLWFEIHLLQTSLITSLFVSENSPVRVDFFFKKKFKSFFMYRFSVISMLFVFYFNYTILIMYLFIYCFKFVKLCIVPCSAVNSDCILKGLDFQFLFYSKYTQLPARACIFKQTTHISL